MPHKDPAEHAAYQRRWRAAHPEKTKAASLRRQAAGLNRVYNLRKYDLSVEEYEMLLTQQNGVCAICQNLCSTGRRLAVDHDHETGAVRGLLCGNCNQGIGKFKDSVKLLEQARKYLER